MKPRFKVWVVFGEGRVKFGDGRARLLALVDELGSLRRAVDRLGMSYRNGWGYFRELERASGIKFLEPRPGAGARSGLGLTREGRAFLARYGRFRQGLDDVVSSAWEAARASERAPPARSEASPTPPAGVGRRRRRSQR